MCLTMLVKAAESDVRAKLAQIAVGPIRTNIEQGMVRAEIETAADVREKVFRLAVSEGWVLLELSQRVSSLEDIFLQLTGGGPR